MFPLTIKRGQWRQILESASTKKLKSLDLCAFLDNQIQDFLKHYFPNDMHICMYVLLKKLVSCDHDQT